MQKPRYSVGCQEDDVPLAAKQWYDFHEFGGHLVNVGSTIMAGTMLRATIALSKGRGLFRIFQTSIRSHAMLGAWIFSAWLGLAGCVYIPPIAQEDAGIDPASFKIGTTSRSDVLSVLGEPLVDDGRFILDELYTSEGGVFVGRRGRRRLHTYRREMDEAASGIQRIRYS